AQIKLVKRLISQPETFDLDKVLIELETKKKFLMKHRSSDYATILKGLESGELIHPNIEEAKRAEVKKLRLIEETEAKRLVKEAEEKAMEAIAEDLEAKAFQLKKQEEEKAKQKALEAKAKAEKLKAAAIKAEKIAAKKAELAALEFEEVED
ncbi:unnamed protein product, partial [marine sediment metagenome]